MNASSRGMGAAQWRCPEPRSLTAPSASGGRCALPATRRGELGHAGVCPPAPLGDRLLGPQGAGRRHPSEHLLRCGGRLRSALRRSARPLHPPLTRRAASTARLTRLVPSSDLLRVAGGSVLRWRVAPFVVGLSSFRAVLARRARPLKRRSVQLSGVAPVAVGLFCQCN